MLHFIAFQNFDFTDSLFVFLITSLLVIVEKAEFQAICYNSPNNNDNNDKFITNEDTTLISSLNTSFTSSNTSNDNASNTVNELNSTPDNNNSSRFSEK